MSEELKKWSADVRGRMVGEIDELEPSAHNLMMEASCVMLAMEKALAAAPSAAPTRTTVWLKEGCVVFDRVLTMEEIAELSKPGLFAAPNAAQLQAVCAVAYQVAGALNAPERFLDLFSNAANGKVDGNPIDTLPFIADEEAQSAAPVDAQANIRAGFEEFARSMDWDLNWNPDYGYSDCNVDYAWIGYMAAVRNQLAAVPPLQISPSSDAGAVTALQKGGAA